MACLLFPCECHQQQTMIVTKDFTFWLFMVILYKCHYEDILFMRSSTNNIFFAQEVSVYMVFLSHPFLKMTNIDKHQGRKMLLTKIVVS